MIYVSIPEDSYQAVKESKLIGGIQYYSVRVLPSTVDGVTSAVEFELDHTPSAAEISELEAQAISKAKGDSIKRVRLHDKSEAVNSFLYNGNSYWFDKATRVGLANSIAIEKISEAENTIIYLGDTPVTLSIDAAEEFLKDLELYAIACYRNTEAHVQAINALTSLSEIRAYDVTTGYPTKVTLVAVEAE